MQVTKGRIEFDLVREVTSRSFVLLRNESGLLPLKSDDVRRVALIGPNAIDPQTQGGGSVRVLAVVRPDIVTSLRDWENSMRSTFSRVA